MAQTCYPRYASSQSYSTAFRDVLFRIEGVIPEHQNVRYVQYTVGSHFFGLDLINLEGASKLSGHYTMGANY